MDLVAQIGNRQRHKSLLEYICIYGFIASDDRTKTQNKKKTLRVEQKLVISLLTQ